MNTDQVAQAKANASELLRTITFRLLDGYLIGSHKGKRIAQHRLVWEANNGPLPPGHVVHHINHVRDDNRPENLRAMTAMAHAELHGREDRVWVGRHSIDRAVMRKIDRHADGLCIRCKQVAYRHPGSTRPHKLCKACLEISSTSSRRAKARRDWLEKHPRRRTCPDCRKPSQCQHALTVCGNCVARHLVQCSAIAGPRPPYARLPPCRAIIQQVVVAEGVAAARALLHQPRATPTHNRATCARAKN